jgi:hypothetical protein
MHFPAMRGLIFLVNQNYNEKNMLAEPIARKSVAARSNRVTIVAQKKLTTLL